MKFAFKAKNGAGEIKEGVIEAANSELATQILQKSGMLPFSIVQQQDVNTAISKTFVKMYESVSNKELVIFFRQLAILIEARVQIVTALLAIREQTSNKYLKVVLGEINSNIEDGMPLSDALAKYKDIFPPLVVNIIRAGEASGNLRKSIDYVAENIERNYILTSRVKSALIYPALILVVFFVIGFLVITIVLPNLTKMIKDMDTVVPWYTSMVINIGDFMSAWWWAVLIVIVGIVVGTIYYIRSESGKKEMDEIKIKVPVLGTVFQSLYITRFSENLAVLLAGGIPIVQAIKVVSEVIGNSLYQELMMKAAEEVKNGGAMSTVFRRSLLIPPMVSHMIKIGEDSGQIDSVLKHISKFYDQEMETSTKNLSVLIEPILMIFIGLAVGFLAFSILMPIYNIAGQIK